MRISDWSSDVCSSDLVCAHGIAHQTGREIGGVEEINPLISNHRVQRFPQCRCRQANIRVPCEGAGDRSEEHTSELQSLMRISYAVFCLKKKKTHRNKNIV